MVSKENFRARQLLGEFVATLTPTDHQPTPDELRAGCDHWMTTNFPAPANLRTGKVDADGVPCLWASMPGTSAERTILYLHGSPLRCPERPTPGCYWSTTGSPRRTRTPPRLMTPARRTGG